MLAKIRAFLTTSSTMKTIEHIALAFTGAFGLTAIATAEHAASTHGFSLSWSFVDGAALAGVTGGYQAIRPQILRLLARLARKTITGKTSPPKP
jgi:hypothetical protein